MASRLDPQFSWVSGESTSEAAGVDGSSHLLDKIIGRENGHVSRQNKCAFIIDYENGEGF